MLLDGLCMYYFGVGGILKASRPNWPLSMRTLKTWPKTRPSQWHSSHIKAPCYQAHAHRCLLVVCALDLCTFSALCTQSLTLAARIGSAIARKLFETMQRWAPVALVLMALGFVALADAQKVTNIPADVSHVKHDLIVIAQAFHQYRMRMCPIISSALLSSSSFTLWWRTCTV